MAAFLTVLFEFFDFLGASFEEIEMYSRTLNSTYNSMESLLHRLPGVFQLSQGADKKPRWWFVGFQTVSVSRFAFWCTVDQDDATLEWNQVVDVVDVSMKKD